MVRRRLPRSLAILLVYIGLFCLLIGLLVVAVPPLASLSIELFQDGLITETASQLTTRLAIFGWEQFNVMLPVFELPAQLQALVDESVETARRQAWPYARTSAYVLSQIFLALVMGFYWLTAREDIVDLVLKLTPADSRPRVRALWRDIETTLGAYVRGQAIMMGFVGLAAFVGLFALRVPNAVALAVVAGLTEAIPMVGPIVGSVPAVLMGFMVSPTTGLLVAGWYVIIQQVEGNVLLPKVMEKNVGLNPLLVILALIAGGILNGVVGALLAVPVVGALQITARHLWIEPVIENHKDMYRTSAGVVTHDQIDHESEDAVRTADAPEQSLQPS